MVRAIRLKGADAARFAKGLLDPAMAEIFASKQVRGAGRTGLKGATNSVGTPILQAPGNAKPKPKQAARNKRSKPIVAPNPHLGPPGHGHVDFFVDGRVREVRLWLDLPPVPKERAYTVTTKHGKTVSFTPARTQSFTALAKDVAKSVLAASAPISGPVEVEIEFKFQAPKSWPKWKIQAAHDGLIEPTGRPDLDNLEKAVLDAANEIVFKDDAFVTAKGVTKIYGPEHGIFIKVSARKRLSINATRAEVDAMRRASEAMPTD
jgi:Holliday junction resolvase RusA-like endonuclease